MISIPALQMFAFSGKIIHVDPWTKLADYSQLSKTDLILLLHERRDYLDKAALDILHIDRHWS
jgi:hypothetical protein